MIRAIFYISFSLVNFCVLAARFLGGVQHALDGSSVGLINVVGLTITTGQLGGLLGQDVAAECMACLLYTSLKSEQKFTQPPARYTEATLIKALEENGIGPVSYTHLDVYKRQGQELAILAHLDDHGAAAQVAHLAGGPVSYTHL